MYKQKNKEANAELKERENTNKKMKQEHARLKQKINNTEREKESIDKEIKELEKVGPSQICEKRFCKIVEILQREVVINCINLIKNDYIVLI